MRRASHVVVGYHHWGLVAGRFCYALARAVAYEGGRIKRVIDIPSPYTDEARNKIVEGFLAIPNEGQENEFLMMIDSDIEFEKDAISKTMMVADIHDADVVWGNYALGTLTNSIFAKDPDEKCELALVMEELKPNMVYTDIFGGGTGWCLMRRGILEKMRQEFPAPWHWFDRDLVIGNGGKRIKMGEDLSFGRRLQQMKAKQVGYTGLVLLHHKLHPTAPEFMKEEVEGMGLKMASADTSHVVG